MRRTRILEGMKATLIAIVGIATAASFGVATGQSTTGPRIQVADRAPLVVVGSGFARRERVTVVATVDGERSRRSVISTYRGTFAARFAEIRLDACTGATLLATGRRSDTVRLKIGLRECPGPAIDYP